MDPTTRADRCERALAAHGDAVFRLALAQTRSVADAQDVSQDVFIKLLHEQRPFASQGHLLAWLLRVTINRCRDIRKSGWSRLVALEGERTGTDAEGDGTAPRATLQDVPDGQRPVEDQAIERLRDHPVWTCLEALDPDQRAVVHLRYVEELDDAQIAKILGVSPITVRTRLHRARKRLRALMAERGRSAAPQPTRDNQKLNGGTLDARYIE